MAVGYVYVLSNSSFAGLLKIGFTCENVETRARVLSSPTSIPAPFQIEYFCLSDDVEEVEKIVHAALEVFRHSERREFFQVSLTEAIAAIEAAARKPQMRFTRPATTLAPASIKTYACRRCGHEYSKTPQQRYCPKCAF